MKKRILSLALACAMVLTGLSLPASAAVNNSAEATLSAVNNFVDFSTDRATWFFKVDGGANAENKSVFCDFFAPYDPISKIVTYDPLVLYKLENSYTVSGTGNDHVVTMALDDLEKLYDPYFAYYLDGTTQSGTLYIRYAWYEKVEVDKFQTRSTTFVFQKHVWNMALAVSNGKAVDGTCTYQPYEKGVGMQVTFDEVTPLEPTTTKMDLSKTPVEYKDGKWYVPANVLMGCMGKECFEDSGYLHIQTKLVDVTYSLTTAERKELANSAGYDGWKDADSNLDTITLPTVTQPKASNIWHGGYVEPASSTTWGDYMDGVLDGSRNTGWLWRSFYLPSGTSCSYTDSDGVTHTHAYEDVDGVKKDMVIDRIIPVNIYVPSSYTKENSRMVYMLHGGVGNENFHTYREMERAVTPTEMDSLAEEYNYVLVSPNGWTRNPLWRQSPATASFLMASWTAMDEFPVSKDKVFLNGNSMGGRGVFELAMRFPEMFRAVAPTAPQLGNAKNCTITASKKYSLNALADMPLITAHGNMDTTIAFADTQAAMTTYVMPVLKNATYITVESGEHSYSYGSVMRVIYDFFEKQITPDTKGQTFDTLYVPGTAGSTVYLDGREYTLKNSTKVVNGTTLISVSDLKDIYGTDFRLYPIVSYANDPTHMRNYYMLVHNNHTLNFLANGWDGGVGDTTLYRTDMDRYTEDQQLLKNEGARVDDAVLTAQPHFSVAPVVENGEIYLPAIEALTALGEKAAVHTPAAPTTPVTPAAPAGSITYTAQKYDTWGVLSVNYYGSYACTTALQRANSGVTLKEGAVITLPGALNGVSRLAPASAGAGEQLYVVQAGDTLGTIAQACYGSSARYMDIFNRNSDRLIDCNTIYAGQIIVLPAK